MLTTETKRVLGLILPDATNNEYNLVFDHIYIYRSGLDTNTDGRQ